MDNKFKKSLKFSLSIAVITFVLAAIFSVISSSVLSGVIWIIGLIIVFIIVFIGVIFDMLGIAATAAEETPFHAMASEKVAGAKEAIVIVRNADRFASFCNDVIGDISGIVSGTASAVVVIQLANTFGHSEGSTVQIVISVVLTSVVAALTVGGKALGKFFAIHSSTKIIFFAARVIGWLEKKLKVKLLSNATTSTKKTR
jgi:CBS domain containing-hemolysin-like protein